MPLDDVDCDGVELSVLLWEGLTEPLCVPVTDLVTVLVEDIVDVTLRVDGPDIVAEDVGVLEGERDLVDVPVREDVGVMRWLRDADALAVLDWDAD